MIRCLASVLTVTAWLHRWQVRFFARAAADTHSMPTGPDDPPLEQRIMLAEWLACGASQ